jgi:hypothetical protein
MRGCERHPQFLEGIRAANGNPFRSIVLKGFYMKQIMFGRRHFQVCHSVSGILPFYSRAPDDQVTMVFTASITGLVKRAISRV